MSSYPMTQLGGGAFNHSSSQDAEAEYDRLRGLAREEAAKRSSWFDKAHQAYERGDGAAAHELSIEGKKHAAQMDAYNKQASDYIFRENNAEGRVAADTIDLHGQYVQEAEEILEKRIRHAQETGQDHLHVIVGKGHHSRDHVQKIKPKVERVSQELGLQFATEENSGRMFINLRGGPAVMPEHPSTPSHGGQHYGGQQQNGGYHQQPYGGQQNAPHHGQGQQSYDGRDSTTYHGQQQPQQQQQYGGQQNTYQGQQQQQGNNDKMAKLMEKVLPKIMARLEKACCAVM